MIYTVRPSIGIRVNEAIANALGIDVGIVYAVIIAIFALTLTAVIIGGQSSETKASRQRRRRSIDDSKR